MVEATFEGGLFLVEWDFDEVFGMGTDLGSIDENPAFGADEGGAVIDDGAVLLGPVAEVCEW